MTAPRVPPPCPSVPDLENLIADEAASDLDDDEVDQDGLVDGGMPASKKARKLKKMNLPKTPAPRTPSKREGSGGVKKRIRSEDLLRYALFTGIVLLALH